MTVLDLLKPVDLRTCKEGDILVSSQGAVLKYIRPTSGNEYLDHFVQYIKMPDGTILNNSFGTRNHAGKVYVNNPLPTDHDIIHIIREN